MLWRNLSLVRAWSATGLLGSALLAAGLTASAWAEPVEPAPKLDTTNETVNVLEASKTGELGLELRGAGQDRVKMTLKNTSGHRLKVVLPAGLVASSVAAQPRGGAGGGGFQSMGLGSASNKAGSFGEFRSTGEKTAGFRSVGVEPKAADPSIAVPAGQSVELMLTSVCLNYGIRTPNAKDKFELLDVDDYTTDPRARKALRSLATYGTGQAVAQAVMWKVCNDVPFEVMSEQSLKVMNRYEIALAARFVEALDASSSSDLVDPAYLTEGRVFVRVTGEGGLAKEAARLSEQLAGMRVLGLPVTVLDARETQEVGTPALLLNVVLTAGQTGETKGRVGLSQANSGRWSPLGKTSFTDGSSPSVLDGAGLARALDHAVASAYVTIKTAKKTSGLTIFKVENRLPFTLSGLTLKAGDSAGAPSVAINALGIAPGRSALIPLEAAGASIDHVEFNGL